MRSRRCFLVATCALALVASLAETGLAQLQPQPGLLKRLWPFFRGPRTPLVLVPQDQQPQKFALVAPPAPPRTIKINTCTLEELQNLPGIGPALGAHLMAGRPFRDYDDLSRDGVPLETVERLRGLISFDR